MVTAFFELNTNRFAAIAIRILHRMGDTSYTMHIIQLKDSSLYFVIVQLSSFLANRQHSLEIHNKLLLALQLFYTLILQRVDLNVAFYTFLS